MNTKKLAPKQALIASLEKRVKDYAKRRQALQRQFWEDDGKLAKRIALFRVEISALKK